MKVYHYTDGNTSVWIHEGQIEYFKSLGEKLSEKNLFAGYKKKSFFDVIRKLFGGRIVPDVQTPDA